MAQAVDSLLSFTVPDATLSRKLQESGFTIINPPTGLLSENADVGYTRRRAYAYYTLHSARLGDTLSGPLSTVLYGGMHPEWLHYTEVVQSVLSRAHAVDHVITEDGISIATRVPGDSPDSREVVVTRIIESGPCYRFQHFSCVGYGVMPRIFGPLLKPLGITLTSGGAFYKISKSLRGVTVEENKDVSDMDFFYRLFSGSDTPYYGYSNYLDSLFRWAAAQDIVTPGGLGLDPDSMTFVGDPALLQDPVFYAFIENVRSYFTSGSRHSREFQARDTAYLQKHLDKALRDHGSEGNGGDSLSGVNNLVDLKLSSMIAKKKIETILLSEVQSEAELQEVTDSWLGQTGSYKPAILQVLGGSEANVKSLAYQKLQNVRAGKQSQPGPIPSAVN